MTEPLNQAGRDLLFREARTHNGWLDRPVSEDTLRELYDLMKWGPTSANSTPMRVVFLRSTAAKERLRPALMEMNIDKTMGAPVTAIVAYDLKFYEKLPRLFPHNQHIRDYFAGMPDLVDSTAQRNSALQGAYFIIAARAVGLDCGPMQGFDSAKVDAEFFEKAAIGDLFPEGDVRTNFLCNLGYGDHSKMFPRSPRLDFDEACVLL
jgi:3-hydroxypropanoate dehydrogenase